MHLDSYANAFMSSRYITIQAYKYLNLYISVSKYSMSLYNIKMIYYSLVKFCIKMTQLIQHSFRKLNKMDRRNFLTAYKVIQI